MSKLETNTIDTISGSTTLTLGGTNANAITIPSGVTLTNNGTQAGLTLSDNILFNAASKGIYLGVTTATASNLLDDYEEGDWTPTLIGSSGSAGSHAYNVQNGAYVKIGRLVVLTGFVSLTNKGSYSGLVFLGNFPFTVDGGDKYYSATTFYNANLTLPANNYGAGAYPVPSNTYANMFSQSSGGSSNLNWSAINNNTQVGAFTIAYISS